MALSGTLALLICGIAYLCRLVFESKKADSRKAHLPPGPKQLPLVGNAFSLPKIKPWETFARWADQFGDMMHLSAAGRDIIVLSSPEHVHGLLGSRAAIYSDRPVVPMAGQLVGFDRGLTMSQDGKRHKQIRRTMASVLNPTAISRLSGLQKQRITDFLTRLEREPEKLREHIRILSSSLVLQVGYGYVADEKDDPFVSIAEKALRAVGIAGQPGAWLVDAFPFLMNLPNWFPGAGFKVKAKEWRSDLDAFYNSVFSWAENQVFGEQTMEDYAKDVDSDTESEAPRPWLASKLEALPPSDPASRDVLLHASAAMYGGGTDTLSSTLSTFFLYMILHPEIQRKAQAQVDAVVGRDRLPTAADRASLPYVEAIMKECLRIIPVAPLGVPHCVREDNTYQGYFIPKGTVVYANIWRILHDPRIYEEPHLFRPERHLQDQFVGNPAAKRYYDPTTYCFGFGRRVCPGRHLAESTLFQCMTAALARFEIRKAEGQDLPKVDCTTGAFSHPFDYPYELVARE